MHTPGLWIIQWGRGRSYPLGIHNGEFNVVTAFGRPAQAESVANARLIAAAPELLAALTDLLTEHESDISSEYGGTTHYAPMMAELQPYRDLIAKAKGGAA